MATFTFICLLPTGGSAALDMQVLESGDVRKHARLLLQEHSSASAVEIWRGEEFIEAVARPAAGWMNEAPTTAAGRSPAHGADRVDPSAAR
ncbi:hypothetical protein [Caulobacter sp.]|uniref:hypothetical protein n=1 Tax=Caulobacter sp. TaxID=78 RepID=UPI0031CDD671